MYFNFKKYKNDKNKISFIINKKIYKKIHNNKKNIIFVLFFPKSVLKFPQKCIKIQKTRGLNSPFCRVLKGLVFLPKRYNKRYIKKDSVT